MHECLRRVAQISREEESQGERAQVSGVVPPGQGAGAVDGARREERTTGVKNMPVIQ